MRRKVKRTSNPGFDEKRLAQAVQKMGINGVPGIEEALLMNNGTAMVFQDPKVSASVQANTCIITAKATEEVNMPSGDQAADENADEPVIEEVVADGSDDEETEEPESAIDQEKSDKHKQSKNEKKVRKTLLGLGMKSAEGYNEMRVRSKGMMFVIKNPDVFKASTKAGSSTYSIFGKIEMQDLSAQEAQARQLMETLRSAQGAPPADEDSDEDCPDLAEISFDDNNGTEELGDLSEDDVGLVMKQASVSRAQAITALKKNDADVVNAIMALAE